MNKKHKSKVVLFADKTEAVVFAAGIAASLLLIVIAVGAMI